MVDVCHDDVSAKAETTLEELREKAHLLVYEWMEATRGFDEGLREQIEWSLNQYFRGP